MKIASRGRTIVYTPKRSENSYTPLLPKKKLSYTPLLPKNILAKAVANQKKH